MTAGARLSALLLLVAVANPNGAAAQRAGGADPDIAKYEALAVKAVKAGGWSCRKIERSAWGGEASGMGYLSISCPRDGSYLARIRLGRGDRTLAVPCKIAPVLFQRRCWAEPKT